LDVGIEIAVGSGFLLCENFSAPCFFQKKFLLEKRPKKWGGRKINLDE
jgi:hypothetical protein